VVAKGSPKSRPPGESPNCWVGWGDIAPWITHGFDYSYRMTVVQTNPPSFVVKASAYQNCDGGWTVSEYTITGTWNGTRFDCIDQISVTNPGA
jgi:hypothetical protein